uniref:Peptidase_M1 domain-containing protein n=1 Tax=Heterorhabditis bacteriophora TaxID=37862 RepID=A0A1I7WDU6_HETBA
MEKYTAPTLDFIYMQKIWFAAVYAELTCARETWGLNKFIDEYDIPTMHNDTSRKMNVIV